MNWYMFKNKEGELDNLRRQQPPSEALLKEYRDGGCDLIPVVVVPVAVMEELRDALNWVCKYCLLNTCINCPVKNLDKLKEAVK